MSGSNLEPQKHIVQDGDSLTIYHHGEAAPKAELIMIKGPDGNPQWVPKPEKPNGNESPSP